MFKFRFWGALLFFGGLALGFTFNQLSEYFPTSESAEIEERDFASTNQRNSNLNLSESGKEWKQVFELEDFRQIESALKSQLTRIQKESSRDAEDLFYGALAEPLLLLRGIVWRSAYVAENFQAFHVLSIGALRRHFEDLSARPEHVRSWSYFFTMPTEKAQPFQTVGEIQQEYLDRLGPAIDRSIGKLSQILERYPKESFENPQLFAVDASMIFGKNERLRTNKDQFYPIYLSDIYALKAQFEQAQSFFLYLSSYNFDDLGRFLHTVGANFRKRSFLGALRADRAPIAYLFDRPMPSLLDFHSELHSGRYSNLFTLQPEAKYKSTVVGQEGSPLSLSLKYLLKAYEDKTQFINHIKYGELPQRSTWLEPIFGVETVELAADRLSIMNSALRSTDYNLSDPFLQKSVRLNLSEIYNPNNPKIRDLKLLMASSKDYQTGNWIKSHQGLKYKNYFYGTKVSLPDPTLGGVFQSVGSYKELLEAKQIVQRSQLGIPLQIWMEMFL